MHFHTPLTYLLHPKFDFTCHFTLALEMISINITLINKSHSYSEHIFSHHLCKGDSDISLETKYIALKSFKYFLYFNFMNMNMFYKK
jgi:hypothetical protein